MSVQREYWEAFDYERMAQESAREQEVLRQILKKRREAGPPAPDKELTWKRENSMLYSMYLEQRANAISFSRRAERRR